MAAVAILIIDVAACCLLRIQPEFGIALPALDLTTAEQAREKRKASYEGQNYGWNGQASAHPLDLQYQKENMHVLQQNVGLKRVYEAPSGSDGTRVLVDRLWPRGLTKAKAKIDQWLRDLAPSNELRKWFHAHRDLWPEFRKRYLQELRNPECAEALARLRDLLIASGHVTLLFASTDTEHNNAVVLKDVLEGSKKTPCRNRPVSSQVRRGRAS